MELKEDHILFQTEIRQRGIEHLIHFTPTINLLSIYEQGKLLSRALLEQFDIEQTDIFDYVEFTDEVRYDDKSFINLSIQHPNTFLFRRFVEKTSKNMYMKWCVIKIDPKFIYHKETKFSITNAANSYNKRNVGITGDLAKFKLMFNDNIRVVTSYNSRTLTRNSLGSKFPTDEQAEVLVKDEIPTSGFMEICFNSEADLAETKAAMNDYDTSKFKVDSTLFLNDRK